MADPLHPVAPGSSSLAPPHSLRAAEVAASLSLATDLGMGFPWEHGLAATMSAMRLCDVVGVDESTRQHTYYLTLLAYVGCSADAVRKDRIFEAPIVEDIVPVIWGGPLQQLRVMVRSLPGPGASRPASLAQVLRGLPRAVADLPEQQLGLCEVAQLVSQRLGLPPEVGGAFYYLTDRWDGRGVLRRGSGEELPLALRIALLSRDAAYWATIADADVAARVAAQRAGRAHDPNLVKLLARHRHDVLDPEPSDSEASTMWDTVLAAEPEPRVALQGSGLDRALTAVGDFADLFSPCFSGHSQGVATLVGRAAVLAGLPEADITRTARAGMVQDVGRASVAVSAWNRPGRLTRGEWEKVRLHPYFTERVFANSPFLRQLGNYAASHHERIDGSGYHRGIGAELLPMGARLLGAADVLHALTQSRPHRGALGLSEAIDVLARKVAGGQLDADAVGAVVEAAGGERPPLPRPAGLTDREAQIVGLLARGLATKQVARLLRISPKTVDRHTEHAYRKIGVSSRAGVTLFATEHGLLAWGELPIGRGTARI